MTQICLRVSGIVCDGCRTLVEAALRDAEKDGAKSAVQWSECEGFPDTGDVLLHSEASTHDLIAAVEATGRECAMVEPTVWRTTRLKVGGMTCGHCSGLVERTLAAVEGVASASVDLAAAQATVIGTASAEVLVAAVEAAGKPAEVLDVVEGPVPQVHVVRATEVHAAEAEEPTTRTQARLRVGGMTCGHCSGRVQEALAAVPGVTSAVVDLEAAEATVAGTAPVSALVAAVEAAGNFDAEVLEAPHHTRTAEATPAGEVAGEAAAATPPVPRTSTTRLKVGGMTCGHCSGLVERTLAAVEGVASASVDLAAAQATVIGTASAEVLVAAVEAAGSFASEVMDVVMDATRVSLTVEGMVCEGCRATVKRALMAVPGVEYAAVDLSAKQAVVSGSAAVPALVAAVSRAGKFRARELCEGPSHLQGPPRAMQLVVEDMICNGCERKVRRALGMVRGVRSVAVDMEAHRVDVVGTAAATAVLAAVAAAGYEPVLIGETDADAAPQGKAAKAEPPAGGAKAERGGAAKGGGGGGGGGEQGGSGGHAKSVGLVVEGMTCSSCVSAIEGLLLGLEGVTHASVSLMAKSAQVGYNERKAVTLTLTPTPITTLTPTLPLPLTRWDTTSARSTCPAYSHASSRAATRRR